MWLFNENVQNFLYHMAFLSIDMQVYMIYILYYPTNLIFIILLKNYWQYWRKRYWSFFDFVSVCSFYLISKELNIKYVYICS